jgi:hypothetical protein
MGMRKPQSEFLDRLVQVVFTNGSLTAMLEKVGEDDGSLYLRQGRTPIWVPLAQVRYVTLAEDPPPPEPDPEEPLT